MRDRTWRKHAAVLSVVALVAVACGDGGTDTAEPGEEGEIATDIGVTEDPCPNAVNEDNGCIYLGVLSDLTEGPFAALGVEIVEGQRAFWQRVNEEGGIGGFDIDIDRYTRDNKYDAQEHVSAYREIEPNILALAQSLGTPPTLAAIELYIEDNVVAAPASWWSGWDFEEVESGLILESGYSYCIESMIALDWASENVGQPSRVMAIGYPGDYGGDGAAGVEAWAEANGAEYLGFTQTAPNAIAGNQDGPVQAIMQGEPDIVQLGVGPREAAEIVGKAAAQGFQGLFMGSVPTWNPALIESEAGPALEALYRHIGPWGAWGSDSDAHGAMQEALGEGESPANDGFTFGWIWSYPVKAALEAAAENGDLTREGVVAVTDGLEVDYEGALPTTTFGGDPNETVVRTAVISQPDSEAPLGLTTLQDGVTGSTADDYDYSSPCVAVE